ncbi:DUF4412 domain-containing protein [Corallibacter sp.]|uniref:DUF4412 domain-containing protein n=1 Tax=Corallibacter sp. TaxID=2038084 RepID=UPI003A8EC749
MKSIIITALLFICSINISQAQFLERLADKATKAAERTVERKVEQKSQKETEKAFDSTFNKKRKSKKSKKQVSKSNKSPNDVYAFTHKYVMQMESDSYNTTLTYYLAKNENYFGSTIQSVSTMVNVMDLDKETLFMFSEAGGTKMLMATSLNINDLADENDDTNNTKIEKTGKTKQILGYSCQEYLITSDDVKANVWVTQNAGVSFPNGFYQVGNKQNTNQQWMSDVNGLVLEMHITDTSKRKPETMKMRCVSLEKEQFKINSSDYKKFM